MGAPQAPPPNAGYGATGPYGPTTQIATITVPHVQMPPGMPPLMPPRHTLQWSCLNEDLMCMVHGEGCAICADYSRHIGQAAQSDSAFSTANANALRDRQIRMHEFFRQHTLSEGGGRPPSDLQRDVDRLREDRDRLREERDQLREERNNLRQEVEHLHGLGDSLKGQLAEAWATADHLQGEVERMAHDNERRYRRRSRSPHRDSGWPRAQDRHYSPHGHRGDGRYSPHGHRGDDRHSSRGGSLQPPSTHHPISASEPAMSRQASTSAIRPPPSHDHWSGPTPGSSRLPVGGPDTAWDPDTWEDDDLILTEAYARDSDEGSDHHAPSHATGHGHPKNRQGAPTGRNAGPSAPPMAPQRTLRLPPRFNAALDPPRVPGGIQPPDAKVWPTPTPVAAADLWSTYVPMTPEQYIELVRSATEHGSGARQRVRDLLYQYDTNKAIRRLGFVFQLKFRWSDPGRKSQPRPHQLNQGARSPSPARAQEDGPGLRNPARTDPPEEWIRYWGAVPNSRPPYMPLMGVAPFYDLEHVRGHLLIRQVVPRYHQRQAGERALFVQALNRLFSIPGLYWLIIERGAYPLGGQERFSPYPGPKANMSIFDLAAWFAHCGLTEESIELMEPMAARYRRHHELGNPNSTEPFREWPTRLEDITNVPPLVELAWVRPTLAVDADIPMGEGGPLPYGTPSPPPGPTGQVPMDETPDPAPSSSTTAVPAVAVPIPAAAPAPPPVVAPAPAAPTPRPTTRASTRATTSATATTPAAARARSRAQGASAASTSAGSSSASAGNAQGPSAGSDKSAPST